MFPHTKPPAGTQINPLHPLSRGLVGGWLFNEGAGSLANDVSGNKNHGRLTNMAPNVQGSGWSGSKFGGGLKFDGDNDYVDCGVNSLDIGVSDFSIEAWINFTIKPPNTRGIVVDRDTGYAGSGTGFNFNITSSGFFQSGIGDGDNGDFANTTYSQDLSDGIWHHISSTYDRDGNMTKYLDGINVQSNNISTINGSINQSTLPLAIGIVDLTLCFNGSIDNVRIYNRVLSAREVAWSYREPYAMFEPAFNPVIIYSPMIIINQFQGVNLGADLYNGAIII